VLDTHQLKSKRANGTGNQGLREFGTAWFSTFVFIQLENNRLLFAPSGAVAMDCTLLPQRRSILEMRPGFLAQQKNGARRPPL
jgi:hypothetical protein